jgi:glycosyltransferase involved in cell wall biosynthesis
MTARTTAAPPRKRVKRGGAAKDEERTARPLLSVIVPVLAPDLELRRCLDSLRLALGDRGDWELILVTPAAVAAEARALSPGTTVCAERRRGIFAAMNDGVKASRGEYLYFVGKDDIALPALRAALDLVAAERPDVAFCDVYWGDVGTYSGWPGKLRVLWRNLCPQGIIYGRAAFLSNGPYVRRMRAQADHYLNIKLLWSREKLKVAYFSKPVLWYSGSGYSSQTGDRVFRRLYPRILRRHVGVLAAGALTLYRVARGKL